MGVVQRGRAGGTACPTTEALGHSRFQREYVEATLLVFQGGDQRSANGGLGRHDSRDERGTHQHRSKRRGQRGGKAKFECVAASTGVAGLATGDMLESAVIFDVRI